MRGDNNSEYFLYFLIENHRHASLLCNGDLIVEETADPSENVIKEASFVRTPLMDPIFTEAPKSERQIFHLAKNDPENFRFFAKNALFFF